MSELIWDFKSSDESGGIIEQRIWAVSKTEGNPFGYKYSLCYIKDGKKRTVPHVEYDKILLEISV